MVDVEELDRLIRDPIEQSEWISNEGNDPDTRTPCDLARASGHVPMRCSIILSRR
jgi:hypothetical protein